MGFGRLKVTHPVIVIAVENGVARPAEFCSCEVSLILRVPPNKANAADCQSKAFIVLGVARQGISRFDTLC